MMEHLLMHTSNYRTSKANIVWVKDLQMRSTIVLYSSLRDGLQAFDASSSVRS